MGRDYYLTVYGSECYPDDGFLVKCEFCDYEMHLSVSVRVEGLREIVEDVQEKINETI